MTATYADDTTSARKQEITKNVEQIPIDTASRKIVGTNIEDSENCSSDEDGAACRIPSSFPGASQRFEHNEFTLCGNLETMNTKKSRGTCEQSEDNTVVENSTRRIIVTGEEVEKANSKDLENIVRDDEKADRGNLGKNEIPNAELEISLDSKVNDLNVNRKKSTPTNSIISRAEITKQIEIEKVTEEASGNVVSRQIEADNSVTLNTAEKVVPYAEDRKGQQRYALFYRGIAVVSRETDTEESKCSDSDEAKANFDKSSRMVYNDYVTLDECSNNDENFTLEEYSKISDKPNVPATGCSKHDVRFAKETLNKDNYCEDLHEPESGISFHEAVRAGDAKSVATLVARGLVQNIDEPDWNVSGDPPLLVAATNHCLPVIRILLANGSDPAIRSPRGETALHRTILNGGPANVLQIVEELLKHGCSPSVKEAGGGLTALHVLTRQLTHAPASKSLHHNVVDALKTLDLLAKVGPVNAKEHQGRSALHILASSSIFVNNQKMEIEPIIRTLLNADADPALKNDRGETALHEALECGALDTAFLLIPHTPVGITSRYGETPLHVAARKNQSDVVASLLECGEDPSAQDAGGNTPLHLASARGFHHTVSLLITSPLVQLETTNNDGLTALQVATESGFVNAVRLLLKAGADPSQTAQYCVTAVHHRHPDIPVLIDDEMTKRRQLAA